MKSVESTTNHSVDLWATASETTSMKTWEIWIHRLLRQTLGRPRLEWRHSLEDMLLTYFQCNHKRRWCDRWTIILGSILFNYLLFYNAYTSRRGRCRSLQNPLAIIDGIFPVSIVDVGPISRGGIRNVEKSVQRLCVHVVLKGLHTIVSMERLFLNFTVIYLRDRRRSYKYISHFTSVGGSKLVSKIPCIVFLSRTFFIGNVFIYSYYAFNK